MKGFSHRTTPLGWDVYRWHYSADVAKDPSTPHGAQWLAEAKKGVKDRDWRKEYEIDYRALGGQLVFPEFDESIHVVRPFPPLNPRDWTVYQGADPHPRRAHGFVWLAVNRYGDKVVAWSWWPEEVNQEREERHQGRLTVAEYSEKLKLVDKSPLFPAPYGRVMDQAGHNFNADEELDYFQKYQACGVHFWPAKKNRDLSGYDSISEDLIPKLREGDEKPRPTLTIMAGCGHNDQLAEQLRTLRFREWKGIVDDKDPPHDPQQKNRHLVDCLGYIQLAQPIFVDRERRAAPWEPIYGNLGY